MHGVHTLQVRHAFQIQDMLDQFLSILHFIEGALPDMMMQPIIAPVRAHLGMHKILVDGSQICRQNLVEDVNYTLLRFHHCLLPSMSLSSCDPSAGSLAL